MTRVTVIAVVTTALVLLLATSAAAQTWRVKNTKGTVVGELVSMADAPLGYGYVYDRHGSQKGSVANQDGYWVIGWGGRMASIWKRNSTVWNIGDPFPPRTSIGRARLVGARWLLTKKIDGKWRKRGSVPKSCPGQLALGGLRLVLWR
jgi:hypothetical protein